MEIFKIVAIALATALLCVYLKNMNSDFFIPVLLTGGILILLFSVEYLVYAFDIFHQFSIKTGVNSGIFKLIIKITIVAYLVEFAESMIEDFGFKSLADKLSFAGKLVLLCMSIPVFKGLLQMIIVFLS